MLESLKGSTAERPSDTRRLAVLAVAAALFAATFAARLAIKDPDALIANFYVVPIALLAIEFGTRARSARAAVALGLVFAWSVLEDVHVGVLGYTSRGAALLVSGAVVGRFSERLREDIAERRRAQRQLSLYADELKRANEHLAQSVERLEAFAEIARAVGGETDLERVLALILDHGRESRRRRSLLVCLPGAGDGTLAAAAACGTRCCSAGSRGGSRARMRAGELDQLIPGAAHAILVPLIFRGETLGVLAGIDRDDGTRVRRGGRAAAAVGRGQRRDRGRDGALGRRRAPAAQPRGGRAGAGALGARAARRDAAGADRRAHGAGGRARPRRSRRRCGAPPRPRMQHLGDEMRSLRDLITELRPAALDDLGLGPAIESLANRQAAAAASRSTCTSSSADASAPARPRTRSTGSSRRRSATSSRHADAARATLRVRQLRSTRRGGRAGRRPRLRPGGPSEGFGLTGMRERAELVGGRLSVSSSARRSDLRDGGPAAACLRANP